MKNNNNIKIAVIVPVFNEELCIEKTINSLVKAGSDTKDIFVINDCSTDNTSNIAKDCNAKVYDLPKNAGKAEATKQGLAHFNITSQYDWVLFIDGDTEVADNFFEVLQASVEQDSTPGIYVGQVVSGRDNNIFSAYRGFEYTFGHNFIKKGQHNFNTIFVSPGCVSCYRSDVLTQLDINSATLGEDMDLTMQVHHLKYTVNYVHELIVFTQDPNNLKDYAKQINRWYRGFWQVVRKHKTLGLTTWKPVDIYLKFITIDSLILNRLLLLALAMYFFTGFEVIVGLTIDYLILAALSLYSSVKTGNWLIFLKSPQFHWLGFLNSFLYIKSFFDIIVLRKTLLEWNKVKRY